MKSSTFVTAILIVKHILFLTGWETARRGDRPAVLTPNLLSTYGGEWAIYRLGHPGRVENVEIDTKHFKGNYPHSFLLQGKLSFPLADLKQK